MHELQQAANRVRFLVEELRQDRISDAAILAALGLSLTDVATRIDRSASFLSGCASDIEAMMLNRVA